ncbi:Lrp/AsnC family transcriptional regulator [Streptomyces arenae]|uniref:Lrp/AsnC family transcriptional regulator n=1 Tax=Streptomyces arenae TaxID=29301 RepID=UPI002657DF56|nr:Lrp/AsnC family transcriptional regulator [Streptomyces arenae]MCG7203690.1 Lrp/AsnC family transcriptional regulator [Streptomyces arenae]
MSANEHGLDALDRRIVAALQVDGRAGWSTVARVLGESERTVARRGRRLLAERLVTVAALVATGETVVVRFDCSPDTVVTAARAVALRPDSIFTYLLSGAGDCVAELQCPADRLAALTLDDLPRLPGLTARAVTPVLRYHRTVRGWQPGILTPDEVAGLHRFPDRDDLSASAPEAVLDPDERKIVAALAADGRRPYEELAALAGMSEATARRRVEALLQAGVISIRASVDPALLGLPVEALLWLRTRPDAIERIGTLAARDPLVRYAAVVTGEHQLLVHVTQPSRAALLDCLGNADWMREATAAETQLVIRALKRSGTPTGD